MNLETSHRKDATVIKIFGKLDISKSEQFETKFVELLAKNPKHMAIDCKDLNFIDSSGIGVLIKCLNHSKNKSVDLTLFDISPAILNIFKLAKLEMFFKLKTRPEFDRLHPDKDDQEMDDFLNSL